MRLIVIITLSVFIAQPALSEEKISPLLQKFLKLKASTLKHQFEFRCGLSTFKLKKTMFSGATIYWHTGLDWKKMDHLTIKPRGISFEGLGAKGGAPKNRLNTYIRLPIYNTAQDYASPLDYFNVKENNIFIPYGYDIDFYSGKLVKRNIAEITDFLTLDTAAYIKNQRTINTSLTLSPSPFVGHNEIHRKPLSWEQRKKKETAEQHERDSSIKETIKRYSRPIKVTTKVYEYSNTSYCHTKEFLE